jgi:hypothetical protein
VSNLGLSCPHPSAILRPMFLGSSDCLRNSKSVTHSISIRNRCLSQDSLHSDLNLAPSGPACKLLLLLNSHEVRKEKEP